MANLPSKKIIFVAVTISLIALVIHGINKEFYNLTGVVQTSRYQLIDVSRLFKESAKDKGGGKSQLGFGNWSYDYNGDITNISFENRHDEVSEAEAIMRTGIEDGDEGEPTQDKEGSNTKNIPIADSRTCTRRNNVAFFKMHKCSSSTVQNILMRYGVRYDLNFVLPPTGNYLGHSYFSKRFAQTFPVKEYNILTHHTRFSKKGFESIMPSNSLYVTILRDPATMFESTFTYLGYPSRYRINGPNPLETFLADPNRYYLPNPGKEHAKDSMLFDLGLETVFKTNKGAVKRKIEEIASDFDLVMMTEYFSESLILLKEAMCWDYEDVMYFKMNSRNKSSIRKVSDSLVDKIRKWNEGDVQLYNYFNRTFWEKVHEFGEERMRAEVAKLEQINDSMKAKCVGDVLINDKSVWHPPGVNVESFALKSSAAKDRDCILMTKTELPFTNYVRQKQLAKYFGGREPTLL